MKVRELFAKDIFRPINGVVKADQVDESTVWQELDEFVVTRELNSHIQKFLVRTSKGSTTRRISTSRARSASGSQAFSAPVNRTSSRF
ncbi:MAG: hypothetical protein JW395_2062 [Nitrospira sp.]|nr:hypothetical protein [Nitrospira sp.]